MRNRDLAEDYVRRAEVRLRALDTLFDGGAWPDVVREAQETVELTLKGLLRFAGIDPPRVHDVSDVLREERDRLPESLQPQVEQLAVVSRDLRRDLELAFYGAEDLTPSQFYSEQDAEQARGMARDVVGRVAPVVLGS